MAEQEGDAKASSKPTTEKRKADDRMEEEPQPSIQEELPTAPGATAMALESHEVEISETASSSLKIGHHATLHFEDFDENDQDEEDLKICWNIRRTTQKPCLCCCQFCACWVFLILLLIVLSAFVASIEFSLDIPFYDRDEINQQREDAYAATVEYADYLARIAGQGGMGVCSHDDPTILTRNGTLVEGPAPSASCQRRTTMSFRLLFISKDRSANILTPENLEQIKAIEDLILSHPHFTRYCYLLDTAFPPTVTRDIDILQPLLVQAAQEEPTYTPCGRMHSFVNLLDPFFFDLDNETGVGYHLMTADQFMQVFDYSSENIEKTIQYWSRYTPRSYNMSDYPFVVATVGGQVDVPNYMIRSTSGEFALGSTEAIGITSSVNMGMPIHGYASASEEASDQFDDIGQWLWEAFDSLLKDSNFGNVDVYWNDSEGAMTNAESGELAMQSFLLFPFSVIGVLLYLIVMQGSFFVGLLGILQILLCFVPTLILYRHSWVVDEDYLGVLNIISFYIILGIGVDDIFVFTDQFQLFKGEKDLTRRMQKAFNSASKAMFTTSCTTFISFIANASSAFPAVRTFGLFSALLVLCNFCAVTTFFPAVYSVYQTRIRQKWFDHPSMLCRCKTEAPDEVDDKDKESALTIFFKNKWAPFILKVRYMILVLFLGIFVLAVVTSTGLEPDESAPTVLPEGNNYLEYNDILLNYFQKAEDPTAIKVRWVAGIDPDHPINRDGTDDTDVTDYGTVNYLGCDTFDPTTTDAQVWSLKTCHDMFFSNVTDYHDSNSEFGVDGIYGNKERNMIDEFVSDDEPNYYTKVTCLAQGMRDWYLTDNGCKILQEFGLPCYDETSTREGCQPWQADNSCEPFPVPASFWGPLLEKFLQDPSTDPRTQMNNYQRYSSYLFAAEYSEDDDRILQKDHSCRTITADDDGGGEKLTLFAMAAEATTTESFAMNFEDGIELFNKWDAWAAQMRKFAPREMAGTFQASNGPWAFYFLNETLLDETFRGVVLSLVLSFLVLTFVSGNIVMAFISVVNITLIVMNVVAFTVLAGYKLGVVEAVLYVVVIGMSIDYSVHMSEAYLEARGATRDERVLWMVQEMGVSVLSGALSTLIAAFFMFFAPNTFFTKFAEFLFVTIALSCLYALVLFPAILSVVGPLGHTGEIYIWIRRTKDRVVHEFAKKYLASKTFLEREGMLNKNQGRGGKVQEGIPVE